MNVSDPFGVVSDPAMPTLALALDPAEVKRQFAARLPRLAGVRSRVALHAIRVTRYKPQCRCVIEYDIEVAGEDCATEAATLIGKVRARRFGKSGFRLLDAFWKAGFAANSEDGIAVPQPIATISKFQMWLQRKVPGKASARLLPEPGGVALAQRIAEAAHKLHLAAVPTERSHTMADELRILRQRLASVGQLKPAWTGRIARLTEACDRLGAATPKPVLCGIHRDFYPDQVIVDGARLYVLDFDLYCAGDPALDIGNFIAHLTEQSLRVLGDVDALAEVQCAMEERFIGLSGETTRAAVRAYSTLTLARHVFLSTLFPERSAFTASLLDLCEQRLGIAGRVYA